MLGHKDGCHCIAKVTPEAYVTKFPCYRHSKSSSSLAACLFKAVAVRSDHPTFRHGSSIKGDQALQTSPAGQRPSSMWRFLSAGQTLAFGDCRSLTSSNAGCLHHTKEVEISVLLALEVFAHTLRTQALHYCAANEAATFLVEEFAPFWLLYPTASGKNFII